MMYEYINRIVICILLCGSVIWFFRMLGRQGIRLKEVISRFSAETSDACRRIQNGKNRGFTAVIPLVRTITYALGCISFILLFFSGFIPFLLTGSPVSGFPLLFHVTVAPVFAVCVTVIVLLEAHRHSFGKNNGNRHLFAKKVYFWVIAVLLPVVMGSIILSMYPVFGTGGQKFLLNLHNAGAILLSVSVLVFSYQVIKSFSSSSRND